MEWILKLIGAGRVMKQLFANYKESEDMITVVNARHMAEIAELKADQALAEREIMRIVLRHWTQDEIEEAKLKASEEAKLKASEEAKP